MNLTTSTSVQPGNLECQDRAEILRFECHLVLAVADGAGGIAGGGEAADLTMRLVRESAESLKTANDCRRLLEEIDVQLARNEECGETTADILAVNATGVLGASVGDSRAWVFSPRGRVVSWLWHGRPEITVAPGCQISMRKNTLSGRRPLL